eukprot:TRINITY_DN17885_c0_g1_i1.p1 TRINITY_DN17885_c0_g1~~TRINITY_DN17885_c0_g1_i1.p1  ORF type:complete len:560 (-),score=98.81 TRINITY_DN17885_c0_g1_i1:546-2225(-)
MRRFLPQQHNSSAAPSTLPVAPLKASKEQAEDQKQRSVVNRMFATVSAVKAKAQNAAVVVEAKAPTLKIHHHMSLGLDKGRRSKLGQKAGGNAPSNNQSDDDAKAAAINEKRVEIICNMGFSVEAARLALERANGNLAIATNLLIEASAWKVSVSDEICGPDACKCDLDAKEQKICDADSSVRLWSLGSSESTSTSSTATSSSPEDYLNFVQDGIEQGDDDCMSEDIQTPFSGRWLGANGDQRMIFGSDVTWGDGIHARLFVHNEKAVSLQVNGERYNAQVEDGRMLWSDGDVWVRLTSSAEVQRLRHRGPLVSQAGATDADRDDDRVLVPTVDNHIGAGGAAAPTDDETPSLLHHAQVALPRVATTTLDNCVKSFFVFDGEEEILFEAPHVASAVDPSAALETVENLPGRPLASIALSTNYYNETSLAEGPSIDGIPRLHAGMGSQELACAALDIVASDTVMCSQDPSSLPREENYHDEANGGACEDIDVGGELGVISPLEGASAWDWPLSRQEKKSRISQIECQVLRMDKRTLMRELLELRMAYRKQHESDNCTHHS